MCVRVRFIREAINMLLPVAQVGGEIAGARVVTFSGIPAALPGATVLVDMFHAGGRTLSVYAGRYRHSP